MKSWMRFWRRWQPPSDTELDEEIRFHLAEETKLRVSRGQSSETAQKDARRDFGNLGLAKDVTRDLWVWTVVDRLAQDFRYAVRMLLKNPGFTVIALAAIALGIGATTAIFTVVNSVLLRPLSFPDPDRLVMVWERAPQGNPTNVVQTQNFLDWRARNRSFEALAAIHPIPMNLTGIGEPEQVMGLRVTADFFPVLRVPPLLGRFIAPADDLPQSPGTVVLTYGLWQRRYGGDPTVLGRKISVNGELLEITGVMPPGFAFPTRRAELFIPLRIDPLGAPKDGRNLLTVARLRAGVTLRAAQQEMESLAVQTARERPEMDAKWGATVVPLAEQTVGEVRLALQVLFAAVVFVLLIACANVANLLLMRSAARAREVTVRMALGAGRWRLLHQLIAESVLLAGIGGFVGLGLAYFGVRVAMGMLPPTFALPRMAEISVDGKVLAFAAAVSFVSGLLFGVVPGLQAMKLNLAQAMHESGRTLTGGNRKLRSALVVLEVAVALLLACGAGLMIRSFVRLHAVNPGFRPDSMLTLRMLLLPSKYDDAARRAGFVEQVLERVRAVPGVRAAGSIHFLPMTGMNSGTWYNRADRPTPRPGEESGGEVSVVSSGYFRTMGIPILAGRDFDRRDHLKSPGVALINQAAARQFYPGEDPIGKRLRIWWNIPEVEIVGLVRDVRHEGLEATPTPCVFLANAQVPNFLTSLVVRTNRDPAAMIGMVKEQIRAVDPDQGVAEIKTMENVIADSVAKPRLQTLLLGVFGAIAVLLACVGIYGVISYSVVQRVREIGVRMALGAESRSILGLVLRQGLGLTLVGVIAGLVASFALTRYLKSLLFEVRPADPGVTLGVTALVIGVAAIACWLPARRATRVDPVVVLRQE
jgi:putative ABC transport system permease protein